METPVLELNDLPSRLTLRIDSNDSNSFHLFRN